MIIARLPYFARLLILVAGPCSLALQANATHAAAPEGLPEVHLADAWVRAMPPGRPMTAAYLRIANHGSQAIVIDGVEASAGEASLHETVVVDGQSRMRHVPSLEIAPGGEIDLAPGGLHIMLMGLDATPAEGDVLRLCVLAGAARACIDAPVRRNAPVAAPLATLTRSLREGRG